MVKNKALPDSSRLSAPASGHSLSLSLPRRFDPIKAGLMCLLSLADAVHPECSPWILPRLDPGIRSYGSSVFNSLEEQKIF